MSNPPGAKEIEFGGPATYSIVVQGALSQNWSSRLGGMRITTRDREDRPALTTLEGRMRDQAELSGVLEALYGLHLPILEVGKRQGRSSV